VKNEVHILDPLSYFYLKQFFNNISIIQTTGVLLSGS